MSGDRPRRDETGRSEAPVGRPQRHDRPRTRPAPPRPAGGCLGIVVEQFDDWRGRGGNPGIRGGAETARCFVTDNADIVEHAGCARDDPAPRTIVHDDDFRSWRSKAPNAREAQLKEIGAGVRRNDDRKRGRQRVSDRVHAVRPSCSAPIGSRNAAAKRMRRRASRSRPAATSPTSRRRWP